MYQRAEALTASKDQKYIILSGSEYDSTTDSARIFIMKLDVNGTLQVFEKSAIRTKGINSAYPNPTFNRVMLDINFSQLPRTLELEIYNLHGQLLESRPILSQEHLAVDLRQFSPGAYLFFIKDDLSGVHATRVIKL